MIYSRNIKCFNVASSGSRKVLEFNKRKKRYFPAKRQCYTLHIDLVLLKSTLWSPHEMVVNNINMKSNITRKQTKAAVPPYETNKNLAHNSQPPKSHKVTTHTTIGHQKVRQQVTSVSQNYQTTCNPTKTLQNAKNPTPFTHSKQTKKTASSARSRMAALIEASCRLVSTEGPFVGRHRWFLSCFVGGGVVIVWWFKMAVSIIGRLQWFAEFGREEWFVFESFC